MFKVNYFFKLFFIILYIFFYISNANSSQTNPQRYEECKFAYIDLISIPDVFKTKQDYYSLFPFKPFLNFCLSQNIKEYNNKSVLKEIFKYDRKVIEKLKQSKTKQERELAFFLERKFEKFKLENSFVSDCIVITIPFNVNNLKTVNVEFIFYVDCFKESPLMKTTLNEFKLPKGNHITAISKNYYGNSKVFTCNGGYVYLVIPVKSIPKEWYQCF
ncbi:hypothetical protein FHQ18_03865 [Deferribacter autotrophicus]|uniref:Uncharacterized protein n=1 Tax=Deferribacter autotrophicus TaxID=500465 RepID=A0A5A8F6B3_9BACT|nr:hypothetical protein [Deferribacter autotrophicus]KAA0259095.1 hypothetical protein FHQ18_03865 [Deferribacter autotrophicus]